jgi:two-component system CheB/CheR fusion protein
MASENNIEELLRLLLTKSLEHAIVLFDTRGVVVWASPGAEYIFAGSTSDIVGQPAERFFTPEDNDVGLAAHELEVARSHGSAEDDRWQVRLDGSRFWASGAAIALRDEEGELLGFGKILRNRTDLKEQIERLRNEVQALIKADRQRDTLLSTLAHELRNPLTPLANAAEILRLSASRHADLEYPVKVIQRQVEALARVIDDLLDLSRISTSKLELRMQKISLQSIVTTAIDDTRAAAEERKHRVQVLMPPGEICVNADRGRLVQVFVNLLINACKYTPEGGRIWVRVASEGSEAVVRVDDNGIGIAPDKLSRIFDLFTQIEPGMSQGGMGIGLALVKDLVTMHGGNVQVYSAGEDKGSRFTVRLPLAS